MDLFVFLRLAIDTAESGKVGATIEMLKELESSMKSGRPFLDGTRGIATEQQMIDVMWDRSVATWQNNQSLKLPKGQEIKGEIDDGIVA